MSQSERKILFMLLLLFSWKMSSSSFCFAFIVNKISMDCMQWPQFQHGFLNSNSKMCFFSPLIPAFKRQHNHCTGVSDSAVCLRALAAADRGGQQTSGLNTLSSVFVFLSSLLPDAVKRSSLNLAPRLRLMNSLLQRCARHTLLRRYDIKVHLTKP